MAVNDATIRLITEFEGFVDKWYADPAHGWKVPTAMYGHTNATGNEPFYKTEADRAIRFTKEQGISTLRKDLLKYEAAVDKLVKVSLDQNQRGALVSFTYNLGEGNFGKSTLLKKVNAKDFVGASKEFAKWNKAGGKVLAGLTRRREAERQLFLSPGKPEVTKPNPVTVNVPTGTNTITAAPAKVDHGTTAVASAGVLGAAFVAFSKAMGWW